MNAEYIPRPLDTLYKLTYVQVSTAWSLQEFLPGRGERGERGGHGPNNCKDTKTLNVVFTGV